MYSDLKDLSYNRVANASADGTTDIWYASSHPDGKQITEAPCPICHPVSKELFCHPQVILHPPYAPCFNYPCLADFDNVLKSILSNIINGDISTSETTWIQASLPVKFGGLGIKFGATQLAPSAFLASCAW